LIEFAITPPETVAVHEYHQTEKGNFRKQIACQENILIEGKRQQAMGE